MTLTTESMNDLEVILAVTAYVRQGHATMDTFLLFSIWCRNKQMLAKGSDTIIWKCGISQCFLDTVHHDIIFLDMNKCIYTKTNHEFGAIRHQIYDFLRLLNCLPFMIPICRTPAGATLLHAAAQEGQLEAKLTQMFPTLLNQATCSLCFNSWFPRHILKPRFDSFLFASSCCCCCCRCCCCCCCCCCFLCSITKAHCHANR